MVERQEDFSITSVKTQITITPAGQLHVTRGNTVLLTGNIPASLRVDIQPEADGFLLEIQNPHGEEVELRFDLASGRHWYGLGELIHQHWPLENGAIPTTPFVTWDNGLTGLGNILEPFWLTATGIGIWVPPDVQNSFTMSLNQPQTTTPTSEWAPELNVTRPSYERPFPVGEVGGDGLLILQFNSKQVRVHLLVGETLQQAQQHFIGRVGHPTTVPNLHHLTLPIWTTWARFKKDITQARCLAFAQEIQAAGFAIGTFEIDDRWQADYGDLTFDASLFPDARAMIAELHEQDIEVTAWVIPFIAPTATCAEEAVRENYVLRKPSGEPYDVMWWDGLGYLLDVSNPKALEWFRNRLTQLQADTGLDGFKFDAGEACYFQSDAQGMLPMDGNEYNRRYIEFVGQYFPSSDVRSGWRNQKAPLLFREWDKFSLWGLGNGLQSVLSQALLFGLLGYPFVLADMIGGNDYGDEHTDAEMMVRWAQANALLPVIQFSLAPWDFGEEVSELCRRATDLHVEFGEEFGRLAKESTETGAPIVRSLVWAYGADPETETIWDEFLLGDRWLVAPVVTPGTTERDVYLPTGTWRMADTGDVHEGPGWIRSISVPLDRLLYFEKL